MKHHVNEWAQWPGAGLHAGKCECGASAAFDTWDELNAWITEHKEKQMTNEENSTDITVRIERRAARRNRGHDASSDIIMSGAGPLIARAECSCGWGWSTNVLGRNEVDVQNLLEAAIEIHQEDQ